MSRTHHHQTPSRRPFLLPGLFLLLLAAADAALAAGLEASLDRTRVAEGEAVTLTLTTSAEGGGTPDWSPLQQDFDLLGQGQSTQMRIVNGRSSSSREWRLTLLPRRTGSIEIPPIRLGGLSSEALSLEVLAAAEAAEAGIPQPVLLEVEAAPQQPFVQQKLVYTVRLLYSAGLADASLGEPSVDQALVYRLGEERAGSAERGGQRYQVIERRYAVLPQRSGTLRIAGPVLNARVADPSARGFAAARPLQRRAPDIAIEVLAPPAGAADPWLPAESLAIDAAWAGGTPVFRVGEPVTRTLAITAQGLAAEQLPELSLEAAGMQVYPDRSRAETRPEGDTLVAQRLLSAAYVPTRAGELVLPELEIAWWDLANGRPALARLPAQRIQVLPAAAGSAAPGSAVPPVTEPRTAAVDEPGGDPALAGGAGPWPWLALLLGLGWALSAVVYWQRRRAVPKPAAGVTAAVTPPAPAPTAIAAATAVAATRTRSRGLAEPARAFAAGDAQAARQALLDWAAARWPESAPRNLEQLGARLAPAARPLLQSIDRALYGSGQGDWDADAVWEALEPLLAAAPAQGETAVEAALPPLYPDPAVRR